jgi:hypothetical protein
MFSFVVRRYLWVISLALPALTVLLLAAQGVDRPVGGTLLSWAGVVGLIASLAATDMSQFQSLRRAMTWAVSWCCVAALLAGGAQIAVAVIS